ncbi:LAFE_0D06502g1_1 [Lachancea fermentati]|uniref:RING-type E3 ubiquitin transferase n=1 Tax=Lachancea fermentati TaxID=4955 RepID=A0A1G4MBM8_LACFM|nr:LAFE_0D06502g1_1 [Lachancea fermentati]
MGSEVDQETIGHEDSNLANATCRICRGESTDDNPLFHPCKCRGSIKYIHESCLIEWVASKNVDINKPGAEVKCDICHYPIQFKTMYDENMPESIPTFLLITKFLGLLFSTMKLALTIAVAVVLLVIGVPLTWNFIGKLYAILLDGAALPIEDNFWMSVLFGYEDNVPKDIKTRDIIIQLLKNYRFSLSQIVLVAVIHIALYFQYDMVVRESIFSKMVYHKIGPRYSKEELMTEKLKQQFPGIDDNTVNHIVQLMKLREERGEEQDIIVEREELVDDENNGAEEHLHPRPEPTLNLANVDENVDDNDNDSDFDTDNMSSSDESEGEMDEIEPDEQEALMENADPFDNIRNRRAVNEFDQLLDARLDAVANGNDNVPVIPLPNNDIPERVDLEGRDVPAIDQQDPAMFSLKLKVENLPVYYIVGTVFVAIYLLLAYVIPTVVGNGLLGLYTFVISIFARGVARLGIMCRLPQLYSMVEDKITVFSSFTAFLSDQCVKPILGYYELYKGGNLKSSTIVQSLPALTTYLTAVYLLCILSEVYAKGFGPKNGMKNLNWRFTFQLFFAIKCSLKVFTLFAIELAGFPILAGLMIDFSLLCPMLYSQRKLFYLFELSSWKPLVWIAYWAVGTWYMFWFAKYVGMIRHYIIRPGVLFFIRSPDDPNIRILHDSLIHPMKIQLSRLTLSMVIYAMFIIVGFGFHTRILFPILLRSNILPIEHHFGRFEGPGICGVLMLCKQIMDSCTSLKLYVRQYWTRVFDICCKKLRLSSFILDKDVSVERGYVMYRNMFYALLFSNKAKWSNPDLYSSPKTLSQAKLLFKENKDVHAYFIPDGTLMRVPANDIISRNFVQTLFVPVTRDDKLLKPLDVERIKERNRQSAGEFNHLDEQSTEFDAYTIVYTPPHFKLRYSTLIALIWLFASVLFIFLALFFNFVAKMIITIVVLPLLWFDDRGANFLAFCKDVTKLSPYTLALGAIFSSLILDKYHKLREARAVHNEHIVPVHEPDENVEDINEDHLEAPVENIEDEEEGWLEFFRGFFSNPTLKLCLLQLACVLIIVNKPSCISYNYFFSYSLFLRQFVMGAEPDKTRVFIPFVSSESAFAASSLFSMDNVPDLLPLLIWIVMDCAFFLVKFMVILPTRLANDGNRNATMRTYYLKAIKANFIECLFTTGLTLLLQLFMCSGEYLLYPQNYTSLPAVMIFLTKYRFTTPAEVAHYTFFQRAFYFISPIVCTAYYTTQYFRKFKNSFNLAVANIKDEVYGRGKTLTNLPDDNDR